MSKILLTVIAFLTACFSFKAQAQVTHLNPSPEDIFEYEFFNLTIADSGSIGTNQVWDFSNAATSGEMYTKAFRALTAQEQTDFPQVNLAYTENGEPDVYYMHASADSLTEYGPSDFLFDNPMVLYTYPINATGYQFSDNVTLDIPGFVSFNSNIQAWSQGSGKLITPFGTFENVIKIRKQNTTHTEMMGVAEEIHIRTFIWINADNNTEILMIEDVDFVNDTEEDYIDSRFLKNANVTGLDKIAANGFSMYPNPASDIIRINHVSQAPDNYSIYTVAGTLVQHGKYTGEINVHTLSPGQYIIRTTTSQGHTGNLKFSKI